MVEILSSDSDQSHGGDHHRDRDIVVPHDRAPIPNGDDRHGQIVDPRSSLYTSSGSNGGVDDRNNLGYNHDLPPSSFGLIDDDLQSGDVDRPYNGVFEGPEKTLEVFFRRVRKTDSEDEYIGAGPQPPGRRVGLRRLTRSELDSVCRRARCTILSSVSNNYLDAYVLSESSLFVYPYMIVIKTCGTTTLLRCVATLIELGKNLGLEIDWVGYSRKNFNFPGDQAFPHESFHQELEYLSSHRKLCERLRGNGYTLGPVTSDHWFVFVADHSIRTSSLEADTDRVLNIMMFDIDEEVAKLFYYDQYEPRKLVESGEEEEETDQEATKRISMEMTKRAGIDALCPGALIDPRAFEPCGYSMNAILFRSYSTMHVTPEVGSSYASFETNQKVSSYASLINNVIRTFQPRRFVMTLMADEGGLRQMRGEDNPFLVTGERSRIVVPVAVGGGAGAGGGGASPGSVAGGVGAGGGGGVPRKNHKLHYKRQNLASITVEEDTSCMMGNWVVDEGDYARMVRSERKRMESVS